MDMVHSMNDGLRQILGVFGSYLSTMMELFRNTFDDLDLDFPSFGFNFKRHKALNQLWRWAVQNPFVLALVCSLVVCSAVKILWWCLCGGKRKQHDAVKGAGVRAGEARRWFTQAECDHEAALSDMSSEPPAFEWACFKCQQASEKAIKAVLIMKYSVSSYGRESHDLCALADLTGDRRLCELTHDLLGLVGIVSQMRYPDMLPYPRIPRDAYSEDQASEAWDITQAILKHVQQTYQIVS